MSHKAPGDTSVCFQPLSADETKDANHGPIDIPTELPFDQLQSVIGTFNTEMDTNGTMNGSQLMMTFSYLMFVGMTTPEDISWTYWIALVLSVTSLLCIAVLLVLLIVRRRKVFQPKPECKIVMMRKTKKLQTAAISLSVALLVINGLLAIVGPLHAMDMMTAMHDDRPPSGSAPVTVADVAGSYNNTS